MGMKRDALAHRFRADFLGQNSAHCWKIRPSQILAKVNRPASSNARFIVKPPTAGRHNVVALMPRPVAHAFRLYWQPLPREHIPERDIP
jgi:hypothetical protein